MASKTLLAFLSYEHFADAHENGKLRTFAERLSGEVQLHWGEPFAIFIDRSDLRWGQEWKARIDSSLDAVTFLIPILTPGYFKSEYCRKEFFRFLKREQELRRSDLILPVYYVRCQVLEDEVKRGQDELAHVLHERQYQDWRNLRHEPWTTPEVARRFEQMALEIVEALERGGLEPPAMTPPLNGAMAFGSQKSASKSLTSIPAEPEAQRKSTPIEPPTVIVDALYQGKYTSISEAIQNECAGTRILVRPGYYREALVIDKPLEIVGDGNRDEIVLEATGKDVVLFKASMGRISNLTVRQAGGGIWDAVDVAQGRLDLEECDLSSHGRVGIAIHGGAEPRVRRNRIHDCNGAGIFVRDKGAGLIEDNEVFGNIRAGILVRTGGNPTIRRNRIHDGKMGGVVVRDKGAGLIETTKFSEMGSLESL